MKPVPYRGKSLTNSRIQKGESVYQLTNCERGKSELTFIKYLLGAKHTLFYLIFTK